jgi:hypothetical protein
MGFNKYESTKETIIDVRAASDEKDSRAKKCVSCDNRTFEKDRICRPCKLFGPPDKRQAA